MTVKLRPGTHYVPVEGGVLVAQRQTSFVLRGPATTLYQLLDESLGLLLDGTDAVALTEAAGNPAAAPVFERIIETLLDKDVLFDVGAGSPAPDAADAARFARTLSYCEAQCADPYGAFGAVRSARVAVVGTGPAAESVVRALVELGVGEVNRDPSQLAGSALAVLVGEGSVLPAVAGPLPASVLPVLPGPDVALVGPLASDADRSATLDWTVALARRAAQWVRADPTEAATAVLSAALAGSLAGRAVLDHVIGVATGPDVATVVHGRLLTTTAVARPRVSVGAADLTAVAGPAIAGELLALTAPLTDRFRGPIRRGADEDLVQLPMSVASAQVVDAPTAPRTVVGWGPDRGASGLDAVLRACRAWLGMSRAERADRPPVPAGTPAAAATGLTPDWAELDGRLRVLGAELLTTPAGPAISWSQLAASRPRALWSLIEDHYGRRVRMRARGLGAGPWCLVSLLDDDGEQAVNHWGFSLESAAFGALGQYAAQLQVDPVSAAGLSAEPIGTQVLSWTAPQQLATGLAATSAGWHSEWTVADEVVGPLPLRMGWVWRR